MISDPKLTTRTPPADPGRENVIAERAARADIAAARRILDKAGTDEEPREGDRLD